MASALLRAAAAAAVLAAAPAAAAAEAATCPAEGCRTEPPVLIQRATSAWRSPPLSLEAQTRSAGNVYQRVGGVGAWGGQCTCPDGTVYNVGDRMDGCAHGPASLACVGGTPGECVKEEVRERDGMQVTCAPEAGAPRACRTSAAWPDLKDGVTCEACRALVLTAPYGGRCDRYCASFGHECVAAAEEVSNNCAVKEQKRCDEEIWGTSDMLCSCREPEVEADQPVAPTPPAGDPTEPEPLPAPMCKLPASWPDLKNGVVCGEACTALVKTAPYAGRCDWYCGSFGHACVGAAEEVADNCAVKYRSGCDEPITGTSDMLCTCQEVPAGVSVPTRPPPPPSEGFQSSGHWVGGSGWCRAEKPASHWNLFRTCGRDVPVSVLSYNLYWWNLYGKRGGNDRSAGRLIERNGPFDVMGFQECDSVGRVLSDARLSGTHVGVQGPAALAIAYAKGSWDLLGTGDGKVGEDRPEQHYGTRSVFWARFRHRTTGKVLFFMVHHGPLPVNTGGICGGTATASQILRQIGENSAAGDLRVLVGDFNADEGSSTQKLLNKHMRREMYHWVDAIYSSCPAEKTRNLGKGGSDHDALSAVIRM